MEDNRVEIKIFAEKPLQNYLEKTLASVIQSIENEAENHLSTVNKDDYLQQKSLEAYVGRLEIDVDKLYISLSEQMVPAERFPSIFTVEAGKSYKKEIINFHVPFSGNKDLFECMPNKNIDWTMKIELFPQEFCFGIINFTDNTSGINKEKDTNLVKILKLLENIVAEVDQYNEQVEYQIQQAYEKRNK
tara:strand:- start:379 stop:945 length:567 start_codon:yes stop_codon:yes gene_type:complete